VTAAFPSVVRAEPLIMVDSPISRYEGEAYIEILKPLSVVSDRFCYGEASSQTVYLNVIGSRSQGRAGDPAYSI